MNYDLVGLIPAAGRGTRIAPLPFSKELFPIGFHKLGQNGDGKLLPKAVSNYLIDQMRTAGVRDITMIVSSGKTDLLEYYGSGRRFGIQVAYLFDDNLRGMPQSMDLAWPWLQGRTVVFGMPDTIFSPTDVFSQLLSHQQKVESDITLGVFSTDRPQKLCVVELGSDGRVLYLEDKPAQTKLTTSWGCACWTPRFTEFMHGFLHDKSISSGSREIVLADVFQAAMDEGMKVHGVYFEGGEYIDMGTPDHLMQTVGRFGSSFDVLK